MTSSTRRVVIAATIASFAAVAIAAWWYWPRTVSASGIEASGQVRGDEVTVSSRLGGTADLVAFREGQLVAKGDLLVQIAARDLEARLEQARAQRDAAASLVRELGAQAEATDVARDQARLGAEAARGIAFHEIHRTDEGEARAKAQVDAAESQLGRDRAAEERFRKLLADGFVSPAYFDEVAARLRTAEANLVAARRGLEEARAMQQKARAASGEASVRERDVARVGAERSRVEAARETARQQERAAAARVVELEAQLADSRIAAPTHATVIAKLVQPGELVAVGRPLATLVDMADLSVRVYVPEIEIGRIRIGDRAHIRIDAFPGRDFAGRVVEISQRAEFTPKEVHVKDERVKLMFGVKVRFDDAQGLAKPGMPADVRIEAVPRDG